MIKKITRIYGNSRLYKRKILGLEIATLANLASVGILGISGIFLNILIGLHYGPEGLGLFNIIMGIFIVFSQFSTFGLHFSVLKWTASHSHNSKSISKILITGLILASCSFLIILVPALMLLLFIDKIFHIHNISYSWALALPGLLFFTFNKILLASLNGQEKMIDYALSQSLRYIMLILTLGIIIYFNFPKKIIPFIITSSEAAVFFLCIYFLRKHLCFFKFKELFYWIVRHFHFGLKSFLAGASVELNSKADVLILGLFVSEREVGIYSFALFIIEGLFQIIAVFRNEINPKISLLFSQRKIFELSELVTSKSTSFFTYTLLATIISNLIFYLYICYFKMADSFRESIFILLLLSVGFVSAARYMPFQFFANQINKPKIQTKLNFNILIANLFLNFLFAPIWGMKGAAIGTSISFVIASFLIRNQIKLTNKKWTSYKSIPQI